MEDAVSESEFKAERCVFASAVRTAELFSLKGPLGKGFSIWHGAIFIESSFPEMVSEKLGLNLAGLQAYSRKLCSSLLPWRNLMATTLQAHPCLLIQKTLGHTIPPVPLSTARGGKPNFSSSKLGQN